MADAQESLFQPLEEARLATRSLTNGRASSNSTSFSDNMSLPVHRWFRYSAGFSADWVREVVKENDASRVLDPFVGSGTTLLGAQSEGAESAGIDLHPFVARVGRAKLAWATPVDSFLARAEDVIQAAGDTEPDLTDAPLLLKKCYEPQTLQDLTALRDALFQESADGPVESLVWLALMGVLRKTSHVGTASWQYVLPEKRKARVAEPKRAFAEQVQLIASDMKLRQGEIATPAVARYLEADVRTADVVRQGWADLVITSPPYANNYDYSDAARLEMTFLGEVASWGDLRPLREILVRSSSQQMRRYNAEEVLGDAPEIAPIRDELTAVYREMSAVRETKAGKKAYHSMAVAYFHDMARSWDRIRRATKPGGRVCFVVGDSAPYGVHLPVERWLGDLAVSAGFKSWEFEKVRDRNNKWENRKHRVPLHEGRLWVEG